MSAFFCQMHCICMIFSSSVMRVSRSSTRASIGALAFLYSGTASRVFGRPPAADAAETGSAARPARLPMDARNCLRLMPIESCLHKVSK